MGECLEPHEILRTMTIAVILLAWLLSLGGLFLLGRHMIVVRRTRDRAFDGAEPETLPLQEDSNGLLGRWLFARAIVVPLPWQSLSS